MSQAPHPASTHREVPEPAELNGRRPEDGEAMPADRPPPVPRDQLRRFALIGLLIVAFGAVAGLVAALVLPTQYAARATLLYPLTEDQPTGFLREDRNLTTQLVLIRSRLVLEPVAVANGMTVEDLEDVVTVTLVEGTEVIEFEVRDPARGRGVVLLDGVVQRYLAVANEDRDDAALAYVDAELADVTARLGAQPGPVEAAALVQRQQSLFEQRDTLNIGEPAARVVVAPYSAPEPAGMGPLYAALTGGLCGLLIAVGVVAVSARGQRRQ